MVSLQKHNYKMVLKKRLYMFFLMAAHVDAPFYVCFCVFFMPAQAL